MSKGMSPKRIVMALGGNAILQPGQAGTFEDQMENVRRTCRQVARVLRQGHEVVITHGNGPQVGNILIQNEAGRGSVPPMPLDVCGAESQGFIGYMIEQGMTEAMEEAGIRREVVAIVTRVVVDANDPSFSKPSKPVGPFYTEEEARRYMAEKGETWKEDAGRGWRKVVPSPDPSDIVEKAAIQVMVEAGFLVVACGGGGIPVVRDGGSYRGVEAVIDKDLAGQRLATALKANLLVILTDVPRVCLNYKTPEEVQLGRLTATEAREYLTQGHFGSGSMEPKVRAAVRFVEAGGEGAVISSLDKAVEAISGSEGTWITA